MSIPVNEQETLVNFMRSDDYMIVYTSDSTQMTKLDRKVKEYPDTWELIETIRDQENKIVAKKYKAPKKLFSLRNSVKTGKGGNPNAGEALRKWREKKQLEKTE